MAVGFWPSNRGSIYSKARCEEYLNIPCFLWKNCIFYDAFKCFSQFYSSYFQIYLAFAFSCISITIGTSVSQFPWNSRSMPQVFSSILKIYTTALHHLYKHAFLKQTRQKYSSPWLVLIYLQCVMVTNSQIWNSLLVNNITLLASCTW